jgi:hypothetical protein
MLAIGLYYPFGVRAGSPTAGRCRSRITSDIILPDLPAKHGSLIPYSVRPSDCVSACLPITSENCPFVNFCFANHYSRSNSSGGLLRFIESKYEPERMKIIT